jgi:hypothetical protein
MQSPGIALSFHREMANSSRELVGPDVSAAVTFESYPRFIKNGFQDYQGLEAGGTAELMAFSGHKTDLPKPAITLSRKDWHSHTNGAVLWPVPRGRTRSVELPAWIEGAGEDPGELRFRAQ